MVNRRLSSLANLYSVCLLQTFTYHTGAPCLIAPEDKQVIRSTLLDAIIRCDAHQVWHTWLSAEAHHPPAGSTCVIAVQAGLIVLADPVIARLILAASI